jgi:hypothetical protein
VHDQAIRAFWQLWREQRHAIEAAIPAGTLREWVDAIASHVSAIHPDLDWEFGAGLRATHYLCLSGKGNPELRLLAERWRLAGPGDDAIFEFHAARPGDGYRPEAQLDFEGTAFPLSGFRVGIEEDGERERLHVQVFHPAFSLVHEPVRGLATYVALDSVLGEDETERWLGGVDLEDVPAPGAVDLGGLLEQVADLRRRATGERFVVLRRTLPSGAATFATVNRAIKRVDHLLLDTHWQAVIPLLDPTEEGLTTSEEAEELDQLEDDLLSRLGRDAVYIGRETQEGTRVLHLHATATGPAGARLEAWAAPLQAAGREVELRAALDPDWAALRRW